MTGRVPFPDRLVLSRGETESLCMKAARGAGFCWGMAEEAGFATGWLAAQGFDATTALLQVLTRRLGQTFALGAPIPAPGHWQSPGNSPLCPIHLGAALTDQALLSGGPFDRETRLDPVGMPLLLLPFLVRAAQVRRKSVAVDWQGGGLVITGSCGFDPQAAQGWAAEPPLTLTITARTQPTAEIPPPAPGRLPGVLLSTLNALDALALRTTVPATQASRTGAGSATPDND